MCFTVLDTLTVPDLGSWSIVYKYLKSSPFLKFGFLWSFKIPLKKMTPPGLCTGFPFAHPTCLGHTCLTPPLLQAAAPLFLYQRALSPLWAPGSLCSMSTLTCGPRFSPTVITIGHHRMICELIFCLPHRKEGCEVRGCFLGADAPSEPSMNMRTNKQEICGRKPQTAP